MDTGHANETGKSKKGAKETEANPAAEKGRKPNRHSTLLVEAAAWASHGLVALVGASTALVSAVAGARPLTAAVRSAGAMLAVGAVLWAFNWLLVRGVFEAARAEFLKSREASRPESTVEWEA